MATEFNFEENTETTEVLKPITITCKNCGTEFTMAPVEQKFYYKHGYNLPKVCLNCRKAEKEVHKFTCVDCNAEFELTGSAIGFYKRKGMELPKRCPACIKYKREHNNT
jgi:hypothetical protein